MSQKITILEKYLPNIHFEKSKNNSTGKNHYHKVVREARRQRTMIGSIFNESEEAIAPPSACSFKNRCKYNDKRYLVT